MSSINIQAQNGKISYGVTKYILDTEAELSELPIHVAPGSQAFVIETNASYMLNSKKEWIKVTVSGGGGGTEEYESLTKEEIDNLFK